MEPAPKHAAAAPASPTVKPATKTKVAAAPAAPVEKGPSIRDRAADTFKEAWCAAERSDPAEAAKAYGAHGFKSPTHFARTWKKLVHKDPAWAEGVIAGLEKSGYKK